MKTIHHIIAIAAFGMLTAGMASSCGSKEKKQESKTVVKDNGIKTDTALVSRLKKFADAPRPSGRFGLYVYDLTADKPVFAIDADHSQPIASNMKLLSGVAALHRLGTRYKYVTSIYTSGTMHKDTLCGDISLKAGLDPQLKAEDMRMFTRELRRQGIRHVKGKVILDLTLKEPVKAEEHWYPWDLSFSKYGILFKGADKIKRALKQSLAASGIATVDSQYALAPTPRGSRCRFRFIRSIDRVTERMWKNSSNTQATSLLYTLGNAVEPHNEDMASAGVGYLRNFLRNDLGMKDTTLVVHDGCGLCTHNHLSPRALGAVLIYAYNHKPIYRQLMQNLSISGVDGTLRRLIYDSRLRGKIHAKTGTLSHPYGISSLAGYCRGADGHELCFALLDSEMSVLDAHVLQRNLCKVLVGVGKKPMH